MPPKKSLMPAVAEKINVPSVDITDIAAGDEIQSDEVIEASLKDLGMTVLSASTLRSAKTLGIHVNGLGVLRTEQGKIIVNQAWIDEMVSVLVKKASKTKNAKNLAALGRVAALLIGKSTESQKLMLESSGVRFKNAPPSEIGR